MANKPLVVGNGFCKHVWAGPPEAGRDWALGLFTTEFTYTIALCLIKLSIIAFYWRIFVLRRLDKILLGILAGMVICWGVGSVRSSILLRSFMMLLMIFDEWQANV